MRIVLLLCLSMAIITSCKKNSPPPKSSTKSITSFQIRKADNPALDADIAGRISQDTIYIETKAGIDMSGLLPIIGHTGATVTPASKSLQNFTQPVRYTVTAEDGSTQSYKTHVKFLSNAKAITGFSFQKANNQQLTIDISATIAGDSILLTLPPGTNTSFLVPSVSYAGASVSPGSEQPKDFTLPVSYVVTAEDGSTKVYTVYVGANAFVFLNGEDGYLYALSGLNGSLKWKTFTGGKAVPTYHDGVVYIAGLNNVVYALNAKDGTVKWQSTPLRGNYELGMPCFWDDKVYFAGSGYLNYPNSNYAYYAAFAYAIDGETGSDAWINPLFTSYTYTTAMKANISVKEGVACIYDWYHGLFVYNAIDGTPLWSTTGDMLGRGNPVITSDKIIYTNEGGIRAMNKTDGTQLWLFRNNLNFTSPTVESNTLFVAAANNLYAMNLDGNIKWQVSLYESIKPYAPVAGNGLVYFPDSQHQLIAYAAENGAQKWRKENFSSFAVLANNEIFVCDKNNRLNCLDAITGNVKWIASIPVVFKQPFCVVDSRDGIHHVSDSGDLN